MLLLTFLTFFSFNIFQNLCLVLQSYVPLTEEWLEQPKYVDKNSAWCYNYSNSTHLLFHSVNWWINLWYDNTLINWIHLTVNKYLNQWNVYQKYWRMLYSNAPDLVIGSSVVCVLVTGKYTGNSNQSMQFNRRKDSDCKYQNL